MKDASIIKNCKNHPLDELDGNWISFQLAISASPLGVIDIAIAPPARMHFLDHSVPVGVLKQVRMSSKAFAEALNEGNHARGVPEKLNKSH